MTKRSIQIYLPPDWGDGMVEAWKWLSDEIITDAEAGQRGAKISMLFQMFCSAMMTNGTETIRLVKEVKRLTLRQADAAPANESEK